MRPSPLTQIRRPGPLLALAAVLLAVLPAARALADALDGVLEVQSAFVSVNQGVYQLYARVKYPASEEAAAALLDGVSLTYDLDVMVERERRYWVNAEVTSVTLRRELSYHTVSGRYVVRDARDGEQSSFGTLESALEAIGTVDGWPIVVESQLKGEGEFQVSLRAGVRRGRLPDALRVLLFWTDDWHRESEWYSWSLPR
ncbi:MAG: DUF4390 domain-containing protein [Steroidobacteraceae bacterium]